MSFKSDHFTRAEFACKCGCGFDVVDAGLLSVLESIRARFSVPVTINSGARCQRHNKAMGGRPDSMHLLGKAADIRVGGIAPGRVASWVEKTFPACYGVGIYDTFIHIDSRQAPARWDERIMTIDKKILLEK